MASPIDIVVVGAGARGHLAYGSYALQHPDEFRVVAVADTDPERRARIGAAHGVPERRRYASWKELAAEPRLARAAINATMDATHLASAVALLDAGYDVLLEKPIATTPDDCVALMRAARASGRTLMVCHVMRYAPFFQAVHGVVRSGRLGMLCSVDWRENLSSWFITHNYVRGRWASAEQTSPMILAKCCHDLDAMGWMLDSPARHVFSSGSSGRFGRDRVGPDVPERCTDGCPVADDCLYFAPRMYAGRTSVASVREHLGMRDGVDDLLDVLRTGPYGRCVYRCDSTAVDHQVVALELEDGLSVTLTMHGGSHVDGRTMRFDGERGTLLGNEARNEIIVHDHVTGAADVIRPVRGEGGHGGGDNALMAAFGEALREGGPVSASIDAALEGHMLGFAAEESRRTASVVGMADFRRAHGLPAAR